MNPPMYISYEDEPAPARSASAQIWRSCARRAAGWTVFYAVLAGAVVALSALGVLDWHLTVS